MFHLSSKTKDKLPAQVNPFPLYPDGHWQVYEPIVLEHFALPWHQCNEELHSSISKETISDFIAFTSRSFPTYKIVPKFLFVADPDNFNAKLFLCRIVFRPHVSKGRMAIVFWTSGLMNSY